MRTVGPVDRVNVVFIKYINHTFNLFLFCVNVNSLFIIIQHSLAHQFKFFNLQLHTLFLQINIYLILLF